MRKMLVLLTFIALGALAHAQNTDSCTDYWNNQYLQGKISCNKEGYVAGTLQGVDCFSTTMDGLPTCYNAKCPTHESGWDIAKDVDVERRITTGPIVQNGKQVCSNHGSGELKRVQNTDGSYRMALDCSDTFVSKTTGTKCKVNPDMQRGFICKQKK